MTKEDLIKELEKLEDGTLLYVTYLDRDGYVQENFELEIVIDSLGQAEIV